MAKSQKLELTWYNKDKALIPTDPNHYSYQWVEENDPRYCETRVLEFGEIVVGKQAPKNPKKTYSALADLQPTKDNLLIQGDSGDVLEALTRTPELARKYNGKVKCIYIDPPFNTEKTFPRYDDNLEHSVWLTMMRDRLYNLKDLLSGDGSIWVHLNDDENHRMRVLLDEVFGMGNFVAEIVWNSTSSPQGGGVAIARTHDVILVYRKSAFTSLNKLPRSAALNARYANPDDDPIGPWANDPRTGPGAISGQTQHPAVYEIQHPITGEIFRPGAGRHWAFERSAIQACLNEFGFYEEVDADLERRSEYSGVPMGKMRSDIKDFRIVKGQEAASKAKALARIREGNWPQFFATKTTFGRKAYIPEGGSTAKTWWTQDEVGHTRESQSEIRALFPNVEPFDTPKPERLLQRIIQIATNPGDLVLDAFAGSGTTAAVAHKMGRRWVICELREDNFAEYAFSRLKSVVEGTDSGGVTKSESRVLKRDAVALEKFDPYAMFKAWQLLNALQDTEDISEDQGEMLEAVKKMIGTAPKKEINWRGGGSFQVARLAPACYDFDSELAAVTLTEKATGDLLVKSVAAQLGFTLTPEHPHFDGVLGIQRLKVVEAFVTEELIDILMSNLADGEELLLAATAIDDDAKRYLRKKSRGSVVRHIPDDLFTVTNAMKAQGEPEIVTVVPQDSNDEVND